MSALPTRPLLLGLYHTVVLDADRVQVCNAGRSVVLSGAGLAERAAPLLAGLDGASTLEELRARFPDLVPGVLEALAAKGLLTDAADREDMREGAPALTATAVASLLPQGEVVRRIAGATVLFAGCGAVGGAVAVLLAKAGVGRLSLVDDASVSRADLAASPALPATAAGSTRAVAVAAACSTLGSGRYDVAGAFSAQALASADLAIVEDRHDQPGGSSLAERCLAAGTAYLVCGQDALTAVVGPLVRSGGAPCHRCAEVRRLSHVAHREEHLAYLDHRAHAAPSPDAFLAAHSAIVAGIAATEALSALSGAAAGGEAVAIDLATWSIARERILPVPGCPACADAAVGAI